MSDYIATREQLDELMLRLVHVVTELPHDAPVPLSDAQLERLVLALNVFPSMRGTWRGLIERLGIGPRLNPPIG